MKSLEALSNVCYIVGCKYSQSLYSPNQSDARRRGKIDYARTSQRTCTLDVLNVSGSVFIYINTLCCLSVYFYMCSTGRRNYRSSLRYSQQLELATARQDFTCLAPQLKPLLSRMHRCVNDVAKKKNAGHNRPRAAGYPRRLGGQKAPSGTNKNQSTTCVC